MELQATEITIYINVSCWLHRKSLLVDVPLHGILRIVVYTEAFLQTVFEAGRPHSTENRPHNLRLDVGLHSHPPVLPGLCKGGIELMTDVRVAICNAYILRAWVALGEERYTCPRYNDYANAHHNRHDNPPWMFRAASR